jgi:hypothetical protein
MRGGDESKGEIYRRIATTSDITIESCAEYLSPKIKALKRNGFTPYDLVQILRGSQNIGIELGVASGNFSKSLIDSSRFTRLYGVDVYRDHHDTPEYLRALVNVGIEKNYSLIRATFSEALQLFPDAFFDFIYVDGYAHLGEDGSQTLCDWYRKLKIGGIFCGDDYHDNWPLVKWAVNHIAFHAQTELTITDGVEGEKNGRYPSWYLFKSRDATLEPDPHLKELVHIIKANLASIPSGTIRPEDVRKLELKIKTAVPLTTKVI